MTITKLDDRTVRQIAAGEVVERPASAVKELVENSLDADATRLDVVVEAGGTEGLRVVDDGAGMTRDEVRLAVEKHTTSKIRDHTDLDDIATLGFRGEALHAIGSVSQLTITTRARGAESATRLHVEHGEVTSIEPAGRAEGTTIEVTDLFGETPARRRFLRAEATEFDHINRIVTRYALANPDVAVGLDHDGREVFATTGQGDLDAAILSVYGRTVAESMIPVDGDGVAGYVSHPETTRSTREYLSTFVNGRFVSSAALRGAILEAYGRQLAADRYPFAVVFLDVPPAAVDVNVHPRKLEVKFDDEAAVRERVIDAIETALLDHGLLRSGAPRGRSAPPDAPVEPDPGPDRQPTGERTGIEADDTAVESSPLSSPTGSTAPDGSADTAADGPSRTSAADAEPRSAAPATDNPDIATATEPSAPGGRPGRLRNAGTQTTLDAETVEEAPEFDRLPAMRLLGQLHETYLVAETEEALLLIDQHAADERIHYERLRRSLDEPAVQALAEPVEVELTAREAALFPTARASLEALGFRATATDERAVEITAVPSVFADPLPPDQVRDVLLESLEDEPDTVEEHADALLADLACRPAITGHTALTEGSVRDLLLALDNCENPYACPHGRPVLIEFDADELADRFERDYPGHGHRRPE